MTAIPKHQQENFQNLPILGLVVEQVSSDLAGADLKDGKIAYQSTSKKLQTVLDGAKGDILTDLEIATGAEIEAKTAGKLLTADKVKITGDTITNADQEIATIGKVNELITLDNEKDVRDQGGLAGNADLTGNSTGNTYLDGSSSVVKGDMFRITSDGSLTVSDGTLAVKSGRILRVINSVADASITLSDLFLDAVVENATNVNLDNSNSNLTSTNVEAAIKEVNAKHEDHATITGEVFTASQNKTLTHSLNSTSIKVLYKVNGSSDAFRELYATNAQANTIDVQMDVAGTYDFIFKKLITA